MYQLSKIKEELTSRIIELTNSIAVAKSILKKSPEGRLRISHNSGTTQYYQLTSSGDTHGKYIRKSYGSLAKELAQKDYSIKFIKVAEEELENIKNALAALKRIDRNPKLQGISSPEEVYHTLRDERKCLVEPILACDSDFVSIWERAANNINDYKAEEKVYPTKKGDMVRSKSEAMLADMYFALGIPYRYEAELILKNGKKVYPDFTLLDVKKRSLIFHEHMGLLDDKEYRCHSFRKISEYRKNGIYSGKNLIITIEGDGCPLNIRDIEISTMEMFGLNDTNQDHYLLGT